MAKKFENPNQLTETDILELLNIDEQTRNSIIELLPNKELKPLLSAFSGRLSSLKDEEKKVIAKVVVITLKKPTNIQAYGVLTEEDLVQLFNIVADENNKAMIDQLPDEKIKNMLNKLFPIIQEVSKNDKQKNLIINICHTFLQNPSDQAALVGIFASNVWTTGSMIFKYKDKLLNIFKELNPPQRGGRRQTKKKIGKWGGRRRYRRQTKKRGAMRSVRARRTRIRITRKR